MNRFRINSFARANICSFARTHACILSPPTLPYAHCLAPQTAKLPSARAAFRLPPARPLIFPFAVRLCARLFARYGTSIGLLVSSFPLTIHSKKLETSWRIMSILNRFCYQSVLLSGFWFVCCPALQWQLLVGRSLLLLLAVATCLAPTFACTSMRTIP